VLVVLDNCEHVLDAAAELVVRMLESSPSLRVLATSREGLAIDGEQLVAVPGLSGASSESAAVALFVDRACNIATSFTLGSEDVEVVAEICRRLDGLPLAIELAAARVGVMTTSDLLRGLDARFDTLAGRHRRRARTRQRTLRESVDWSYRLLDPHERRAFDRLSVFAASFDRHGARTVLGDVDDLAVLDLVEALVDKSLLTVVDIEGSRRYRYLETLRAYAEERLTARGDTETVMSLLHQHLATVVAGAVDEMFARPVDGWRLRVEIPNLRRALDDALDRHDVAGATALIAPFADLFGKIDWRISGWAEQVLALPEAAGTSFEPQLLALHAIDRWLADDFAVLRGLADRMLQLAAAFGEIPFGVLETAQHLYSFVGDDDTSRRLTRDMVDTASDGRAVHVRAYGYRIDLMPSQPGAVIEVGEAFDADLDAARSHPSRITCAAAATIDALHACVNDDAERMLTMSRRAAELGVVGSARWFAALQIQAWAQYQLGKHAGAIRTADDDLEQAYRYGDRSAMIIPITIYAVVLHALGEVEAAATVRGALPRRLTLLMVSELAELDRRLAAELDPQRRRELAARGQAMDPRALQDLTHATLTPHIDLTRNDTA
jgi:predicted ATPase